MSSPVLHEGGGSILLGSDFDGTQFLTFETGRGIVGVSEAYAVGLDAILGSHAADQFREDGGHNHRTPAEIVRDLMQDAVNEEVDRVALQLTELKIGILTDQVGKHLPDGAMWPRPTVGFLECWESIQRRKSDDQNSVVTATLSAGHVPFIQRVHEIRGLELPDIVMTDDVLVDKYGMGETPAEKRAKPNTPLLRIASAQWLAMIGVEVSEEALEAARGNTIYIGDALEKDGGLARNYGVDFVHLDPERSRENWGEVERWLGLGAVGSRSLESHEA
jgi:hypothetical protein